MRKQRTSKFVGKEFDNGWVCTGINVARCTLTHKNGGPTYWYAFERMTSDGKCDKWIRVEASEATKIWKHSLDVETLCIQREIAEAKGTNTPTHGVNYQFIK